jgi:hypothetical protein
LATAHRPRRGSTWPWLRSHRGRAHCSGYRGQRHPMVLHYFTTDPLG